jgi:hypothetical protein
MSEDQLILSVMTDILLAVTDKQYRDWLDKQTPDTLMEYVREKLASVEIYTLPIGASHAVLVTEEQYRKEH